MREYHKIQTVYKRDPDNRNKTLLEGQFSIPEFEYLQNNKWVFTEKVNGTNIRIMWDGKKVRYGGRTDNAMIPARLLENLPKISLVDRMADLFSVIGPNEPMCIYGEGYGAKIQGGGNYRPDQSLVVFDVRIGNWWLRRENVEDIAHKLELGTVPIIGEGTLADMVERVRTGFNSRWDEITNFKAEGIVAKPAVELTARNGSRIITKLKYKDFPR